MKEVSVIDFLTLPSKGTIYRQGAKEFRSVDYEGYTRKTDGAATYLIAWESTCKTCGKPYRVKSGMKAKWLAVNCDKHRGRQ